MGDLRVFYVLYTSGCVLDQEKEWKCPLAPQKKKKIWGLVKFSKFSKKIYCYFGISVIWNVIINQPWSHFFGKKILAGGSQWTYGIPKFRKISLHFWNLRVLKRNDKSFLDTFFWKKFWLGVSKVTFLDLLEFSNFFLHFLSIRECLGRCRRYFKAERALREERALYWNRIGTTCMHESVYF